MKKKPSFTLSGLPSLAQPLAEKVVSSEAELRRASSAARRMEIATFAAGCFWGVEETFRVLPGVLKTEVGYCGGSSENPTYEQVCFDQTGHAEAVQIVFDPKKISYQKLLDVFFSSHNPTTLNSQGPDFGSHYRSAIFVHSPQERTLAEATIAREQSSPKWRGRKIVTQISDAVPFYSAEDYHQKYLMKRGLGSCHL